MVELRQLIHPFLIQLLGGVLLQRVDQLRSGGSLRPQNHVPQKVLPGILGRQVAELSVVVLRLVDIVLLEGEIRQLVEQPLADGRTLKSQQKDIFCLPVLPISLIDLSHHGQQVDISHPSPVYGVGDAHRSPIVAFIYPFLYLFNFYVKLSFIHLRFS